ncbi:MAG: retroviral-like aspartic protease family protein [Cyanobacteria bacterium P01_F01_bin.150]
MHQLTGPMQTSSAKPQSCKAYKQRALDDANPSALSLRLIAALISGLLVTGMSSCSLIEEQLGIETDKTSEAGTNAVDIEKAEERQTSDNLAVASSPSSDGQATASSDTASEAVAQASDNPSPAPDTYPDALKRAEMALKLSQSAQSVDDWSLVAGRWQQAIDLLEAVPAASENYGSALAKLAEYRGKRDAAKTQANQPIPSSSPLGSVVVTAGGDENSATALTSDSDNPSNIDDGSSPGVTDSETPDGRDASASTISGPSENGGEGDINVYRTPIIRRSGGTPVIQVKFNGQYTVEMILDTGAGRTLLTQRVARALNVQVTGQTAGNIANGQTVIFQRGRVASISVEGATVENVEVAIAGPALDTGLLGNDFFRDYDVTVKSDVVEFRRR